MSGGSERDGRAGTRTREAADSARTIADRCLATRARRLDRELARIYNDALKPWDVTQTQLSLLVAIVLLEPIAAGELARHVGLEKSTASRNLRLLLEHGWAAPSGEEDARRRLWSVTESGDELIRRAYPAWLRAQDRAREALAGQERTWWSP